MQICKFERVVGLLVILTLLFVWEVNDSLAAVSYCCHMLDNEGRLACRVCNAKGGGAGWNCVKVDSCEKKCPPYPTGSPITIKFPSLKIIQELEHCIEVLEKKKGK